MIGISPGRKENEGSRQCWEVVGKRGPWGGERRQMPGVPAYTIFCPLSAEDRSPELQ